MNKNTYSNTFRECAYWPLTFLLKMVSAMGINCFYFVKSLCFCSNETVTFVCNVTRLTIEKTHLTIRLSKVKYLHRRKLKQKHTFA